MIGQNGKGDCEFCFTNLKNDQIAEVTIKFNKNGLNDPGLCILCSRLCSNKMAGIQMEIILFRKPHESANRMLL